MQTQRIRAINEQKHRRSDRGTGAVAALGLGSIPSVGKVGGLVAVGALGALAVRQAETQAQSAETVRFFPENHLMAGAFAIPPKLFAEEVGSHSMPSRKCCLPLRDSGVVVATK